MNNIKDILYKYYPTSNPLRETLFTHSEQVCKRALAIAERHPEMNLDLQLVHDGAWVHDIGIYLTNAPGIYCEGDAPYLMHGYLGAQIMRREGYEQLARICERHTGIGLTASDVKTLQLPIPEQDYLPEKPEELLICYADKFYSKSKLNTEKTPEQVYNSMLRFGKDKADTFMEWKVFGES